MREFERLICQVTGAKYVVATSSCTAALHISLVAMGIEAGSEVITSPLTFAATSNVILHVRARPVFADIDCETGNIDPEMIKKLITPATKAIIPVHYAGQPCDMDEIRALAAHYGLKVIEDAAHAIGATYRGRPIGSDAEAACYSFYPNKNITTGEGGAVACNDEALALRLRMLINHGMSNDAWRRYSDKGSWYYEVTLPGFKYNMTDIQAAIGIGQIKHLEEFVGRRAYIAQRYNMAFASLPGVSIPIVRSDRRTAWHLYVLRLGANARMKRNAFIDELRTRHNIGSTVNFIPLPMHPYLCLAASISEDDR